MLIRQARFTGRITHKHKDTFLHGDREVQQAGDASDGDGGQLDQTGGDHQRHTRRHHETGLTRAFQGHHIAGTAAKNDLGSQLAKVSGQFEIFRQRPVFMR